MVNNNFENWGVTHDRQSRKTTTKCCIIFITADFCVAAFRELGEFMRSTLELVFIDV